ncbi:MAG: uracil-DNA glycosylase family protein [Prevotella sp.]|nr:uracil-DNA glycosylase family protein [Prevotella sp.]MBQ4296032.1 uracil-DNA glycosylase family protein [Prevotella sp.]
MLDDEIKAGGDIERHPWEPFLPDGTKMLFLGSFPPAPRRWAMDFFYPNYINDMWRIFGICLFDDKNRLVDEERRTFRLEDIKDLLRLWGIGLYDTAVVVRRLRNTASDKDLEVLQATDFDKLLSAIPECHTVVTTGQKATDIFTNHFGIPQPKVGEGVAFQFEGRDMRLCRMPSSSRAYPMALEKKAACYMPLFQRLKKEKQNY